MYSAFRVPQPSMAINSLNLSYFYYKMTKTWNRVDENMPPDLLLSTVSLKVGEKMKCLIINCHGFTNKRRQGGFGLDIGSGITLEETKYFSFVKGLFNCIILPNCQVSRVTKKGTYGDGKLLCSKIAIASGAYVIAPVFTQIRPSGLPRYYMDKFEGLVRRFNPSGALEKNSLRGRKLIRDVAS